MSETYGTFWVQQIFCCCFFFPSCNVTRTCLRLQIEDLSCWMTVLREEQNCSQRGLQEGKKRFSIPVHGKHLRDVQPQQQMPPPSLPGLPVPSSRTVSDTDQLPAQKKPTGLRQFNSPMLSFKEVLTEFSQKEKNHEENFPIQVAKEAQCVSATWNKI